MFQQQANGMAQGHLYTRADIANALYALEITVPETDYQRGWMEALVRAGRAFGLEYRAGAQAIPALPARQHMEKGR